MRDRSSGRRVAFERTTGENWTFGGPEAAVFGDRARGQFRSWRRATGIGAKIFRDTPVKNEVKGLSFTVLTFLKSPSVERQGRPFVDGSAERTEDLNKALLGFADTLRELRRSGLSPVPSWFMQERPFHARVPLPARAKSVPFTQEV